MLNYLRFLLSWCLFCCVASFYHTQSMQIIRPPSKLPEDSYFGFSMTFDQTKKELVISAPNDGNIGTVYSCKIINTLQCQHLNLVPKDDIKYQSTDENIQERYGNWFGATTKYMASGLVVCAPRWMDEFSDKQYKYSEKIGTSGRCYLRPNNASEATKLPGLKKKDFNEKCPVLRTVTKTPCRISNVLTSLGWSLDSRGNSVLIGGPGTQKGRVVLQGSDLTNQVHLHPRQSSYNFGYAVAFGNFFPNKENVFAAASPYDQGKVFIMSEEKSKLVIERELRAVGQTGSRSGAVLCAVRLELHARDSLLVGAPAHAAGDLTRRSYNVGAVHLMDVARQPSALVRTIEGEYNGAMFGSAIVNIGDIDGDGIEDVAISAPYEDAGAGAVYIYSGAALKDLVGTWMQKIHPKKNDVMGFGLSLEAFHFEGRTCKDLAIGSPLSGHVSVVKCIMSAILNVSAEFPPLQNRTNLEYFEFNSCVKMIYPVMPQRAVINITMTVDLAHDSKPAAKINEKGTMSSKIVYTEILNNTVKSVFCRAVKVNTPKSGDYDKDIVYRISASAESLLGDTYDAGYVAVSERSNLSAEGSVSAAECRGAGAECTPSLHLTIQRSLKALYVVGSSKTEPVSVGVQNTGSGAVYGVCVLVRTHGVRLRVEGELDVTTKCQSVSTFEAKCNRLESLRNNQTWVINKGLFLDTEELSSASEMVSLNVDVYNSACAHLMHPLSSASDHFTLRAEPLNVEGSVENQKQKNLTWTKLEHSNGTIKHIYTIVNHGVTNWIDVVCEVKLEVQLYTKISKVYVQSTSRELVECYSKNSTENEYYTCLVGNLGRKNGISTVYVDIDIFNRDEFENDIRMNNASVTSYIKVYLKNEKYVNATITTGISIIEATVPLWVIIVASLIGLLLVLLLYITLKECGLFQRKHQKKLKSLKRGLSNHRQSMRLQSRPQTLCADEGDELVVVD